MATHQRSPTPNTDRMLPTTPALPAVATLPATPALPLVAIDPATPMLPAVAMLPATPMLPAEAIEPATAMLPDVLELPMTAMPPQSVGTTGSVPVRLTGPNLLAGRTDGVRRACGCRT